MSPSEGELDRFLAELRGRGQRLLGLVDAQDLEHAALVAEVHELSDQLIVAEDELRLQQEELEAARQRIAALTEYGSRLFESFPAVVVLTDERGVVLRSTRAAAELMRQPAGPRLRRPFATWFEMADRSRIRSLVSRSNGAEHQGLKRMLLRRADGSTQLVDVALTSVQVPTEKGPVLRWELTVVETVLRVVSSTALGRSVDLAVELTALVSRLAVLTTVQATLAAMVEEAVRLVPGAEHALVVELHGRRAVNLLVASDCDAETAAASSHLLTVPLRLPGFGVTLLQLSAERPLGPEATEVAELLAVHFRLATARVRQRENLERALETRQLIGQAVGVLVERRRLTPAVAFEELVQRSQLANLKLREIARIVIETGQDPEQISAR